MTFVATLPTPAPDESRAPPGGESHPAPRLVLPETEWRRRPVQEDPEEPARHATLSRWRFAASDELLAPPMEVFADDAEPCHVVTVALKPMHSRFRWNETWLVDGEVPAYATMITGPRDHSCRAEFQHSADLFRIFLPPGLVGECMAGLVPLHPVTALCGAEIVKDDILTRLACSLVNIDDHAGSLAPTLVEGVSIAMTARLIALFVGAGRRRKTAPRGLARWRLTRVLDYIEANFRRPLSLDELSQIAGLSRIRFGAQFREATGVTPYAFMLQRRIAYCQQLLRESNMPLVEVALMAGFSSQAHFTTIFSRVTGVSPGQWRRTARG